MKIFVILPRVPYPLEKGDKLRAFNQIKYLSHTNEIHLCALNDSKIHPKALESLHPFCKSITLLNLPLNVRLFNLFLSFFNGKPFQVAYFFNNKNYNIIQNLIATVKPDRIYCQLIRVTEYVKSQPIKKTLDYQDVFSVGLKRRIKASSIFIRPALIIEYKRLLKYEAQVFDMFDRKTIISYPDRNLIPHPEREKIVVIPNGVDSDYYFLQECEKEFDLIFTGNMGYLPNINSVEFLVKKILPIVYIKYPKVKLLIAGTNPSKKVLKLKSENVSVTGWVKDMRDCYAKSKIFVAPMLIGTGLQNKLLEAMSMMLPCITSNLANCALGAVNGKDILIGNSPEDYAKLIIFLLDDENKAKSLGKSGHSFIIENYNWEKINERLSQVICS
ncbi:MAG: glycosyltransferase [Bacteroidetes bacterium]|nr:glycosyltransferase [Bacteroidota bacterium]